MQFLFEVVPPSLVHCEADLLLDLVGWLRLLFVERFLEQVFESEFGFSPYRRLYLLLNSPLPLLLLLDLALVEHLLLEV